MITAINQPNTESPVKVQGLSMPNVLLRLEGLTVLVAAVAAYAHQGGSLWLFLALLLAPDLAMIAYARSVRFGSVVYNAVHVYSVPALLAGMALALNIPTLLLIALIWLAHIGMDRVAGYGLKYPTEFKDTHMQRV